MKEEEALEDLLSNDSESEPYSVNDGKQNSSQFNKKTRSPIKKRYCAPSIQRNEHYEEKEEE